MIAALFVAKNGPYFGIPDVDPWDEKRDARLYAGPWPVVAHPPCQRWGRMWFGQPLAISRGAAKQKLGDDGGCFESALNSLEKWCGVIEHPEGSRAWDRFGFDKPPRDGGWYMAGRYGWWTCRVEQGRYGHYARKPTWLLARIASPGRDLPELEWGVSEPRYDPAVIERMGLKRAKRLGEVGARGGGRNSAPRIHTPAPFRDLLLSIARTVK